MSSTIDPRTSPHRVVVVARDGSIRDTIDQLDGGTLTARCEVLACALGAYRSIYWSHERFSGPPANASQRHLVLHEILRLDRGRSLGEWAIWKIADAERRQELTHE